MFSEYTNIYGKSLINYSDEENNIIAKAIPIMDVSNMKDIFYNTFSGANFEASRQFTYSHCIVDLDPDYDKYNYGSPFPLDNGQFPMSFASDVNVNVDDYKKTKLVL